VSSIETRRHPTTGTVSCRVKFRHLGRQASKTFLTEKDALGWKAVLDAIGPDAALRFLEDQPSPLDPTIADLATALTVGALDRGAHSARIHTAWKQSGKQGAPKSRRSRRTVAVPEQVFVALEPLIAGKRPGDLVFLSPRGARVRSGNFYNQVWGPLVERVGPSIGKHPRVHDLRHSFASWALQAGIPLPVVQRQLGHESITTTVDTYGHLARSDFDPLLSLGVGFVEPAQIEV
jgi:integrase